MNIQFAMAIEMVGGFHLGIEIYHDNSGSLGCRVYHKPTHTDLSLYGVSHYHPAQKHMILSTLVPTARMVSHAQSLPQELDPPGEGIWAQWLQHLRYFLGVK